jgi:hypothetical protein
MGCVASRRVEFRRVSVSRFSASAIGIAATESIGSVTRMPNATFSDLLALSAPFVHPMTRVRLGRHLSRALPTQWPWFYAGLGGRPPPFWAYAGDMGTRAQIEQLVAQATAKAPDANARIDALEKAGPPVLVALMIIADAIDVLRQQVDAMDQTMGSDDSNDLTAQLSTLTSQLTKLTKTAKKITKEKKTKKIKKKKKRNKNNR